jgi:hypothetical protein
MPRPFQLASISVVFALTLIGCMPTAWTPVPLPTRADTAQVITGKVRVYRTSGDTLTGAGLTIRGDSAWLAKVPEGYQLIPLGEILKLERDRDAGRGGIGGGIIVGMVGAIVLYLLMEDALDDFDLPCTDNPC